MESRPRAAFLAIAVPCLVAACAGSPAAKPSDFLHERIVSVAVGPDGVAHVGFERSQRMFVIDPSASPDAKAMLAFAEAARTSGRPVHATVAPSGQRTKGDSGPAFVLVRLADTPDPAAPGR
jgi:hypothetical protein